MIPFKRYTRLLICSAGLIGAALLSACGSGDQSRDPILGLPAATLVGVAVTPATASIALGAVQQLTATAIYTDGSARDVSASASWTSATATVATVNAAGMATGASIGTAIVTAAFASKSGTATITVGPAALVSLALTPAVTAFQIGATRQLAVAATYSDGTIVDVTGRSTYASGNAAFVSVSSSGLITGIATGASTLSASFAGQTATAQATTTAVTISSIAVSPATATVATGATQQFIAVATYSDNSTAVITSSAAWSSTNITVATVSNTGAATGISAGTALMTATLGMRSGNGMLTVTAFPGTTPVTVAPVNLGRAASFAVLAGTALTNNSGGTTLITGDVGSPSQTTAPTVAPGFTNYQSGAILDNGLADLQVAITDANSRNCDVNFAGDINLGGTTLPPGVYCYTGAISITGTLNLSGPGVYIFRTALTLDTTANSVVALTNGATAANVTWVPVGPSTLGANSAFIGTILGQSAAITVGDNTTLLGGRVLSGAAVTLRNNQIIK
jgi:hypothetical protein